MKKRLFLLIIAALAVFSYADAQNYVVYAVSGKAEVVMPNGKRDIKLRETLYASSIINLPYGATVELIDVDSRKQYTLRTPGKGKLESMLSDRRNSVLKLTSKYFDYVLAQVKGSSQVVSRRCSDPATVTREIEIDSMYVKEIGPVVKDSTELSSTNNHE